MPNFVKFPYDFFSSDMWLAATENVPARTRVYVVEGYVRLFAFCYAAQCRGSGPGFGGVMSPAMVRAQLPWTPRQNERVFQAFMDCGFILPLSTGDVEVAGWCRLYPSPWPMSGSLAANEHSVSEQFQALDPPLDLDQDLHTTTHTQHPPENPPARERDHSADVERQEEAVHPNEPEPPHPADDPAHEPPPRRELKPTRRADGVCVGVQKHGNHGKPKPYLAVVPSIPRQTHEDAPQATQEVAPISEPTPTPNRPLETNVEPLTEDELTTALETETNEVKRDMLAMQLRLLRRGKLREGADEGAERDRQQREVEAEAAAERAAKARQEAMDRRPLPLAEFRRALEEMDIPGTIHATRYRFWVPMGVLREVVGGIREQMARNPEVHLNAGLVMYRCQGVVAQRRQTLDEPVFDPKVAAVASAVASGLRVGYEEQMRRETA